MSKNVIEVKNLEKYFEISGGLFSRKKGVVKAVDDISFEICRIRGDYLDERRRRDRSNPIRFV